jgi:5'-deoxynucleotidase YfbR-like HD superfamily hydrolase
VNLQDIYAQYHIPPGLQRHMLTVAAVGKYITDHWRGPAIDKQAIITTLLVHDLGNLVKFDLSASAQVIEPILTTDEWRARQKQMRKKYGSNSHQATVEILQELGVPDETQQLAEKMDAGDICKIVHESLEQQICEYSDLRVTPKGVVSLEVRLEDLRDRYWQKTGWGNKEEFQKSLDCGRKIEQTLQQHTTTKITQIPTEIIDSYLVELARFKFGAN